MHEPIRLGLLSFAHYHANFWAAAALQSRDMQLVGIWDDDAARGMQAATEYRTRFFRDLDSLLERCDVVGITSETSKHAMLVEAAARAGKHILLEKPMATTLADCARIQRALLKSNVLFMQNFPKRYDPVNGELVTRVQQGELGRVNLVRVRHGNYHLLELGDRARDEWYCRPELSGGGALIDEGSHVADFLLWLLGEPSTVIASISNAATGLAVEDTAVAQFTFPSGTLAEICISNIFVAAQDSIEVYGTQGTAIIRGVDLASRDFCDAPYLRLFRTGQARGQWEASQATTRFHQGDFHHQGLRTLIDSLRTGQAPVVSFSEGWKSLAMVLAAYDSARTGQVRTIDFSTLTEQISSAKEFDSK
jgi:myo-inositol 2-dehydrogenase / D-chiro-inositol 1-dehydrogenase